MSPRFSVYLTMLATRDAALLQLALLALAGLVCWLGLRAAFGSRGRNCIIALGAIVYHLTLLVIILNGGT